MTTETLDRPVPYSLEAEDAVIGSLLLDRDGIAKVASYLTPAHFYQESRGALFGLIYDLYLRGVPADTVTLYGEIQARGWATRLEAPGCLFAFVASTPTHVHLEHYAQMVEERARLRGAIQGGGQIAALGYQDGAPVGDVMAQIRAIAERITTGPDSHGLRSLREIGEGVMDQVLAVRDSPNTITGVPSGVRALDALTGGFQPGDLYILAARPSVGKTSLATQIAAHAAGQGFTVGFFSLEMSNAQLYQRLLAQTTPCDLHRLRLGARDVPWDRVRDQFAVLSELRLFIDDQALQTVGAAIAHARQRHISDPLGVLLFDYLQLFEGAGTVGHPRSNRQEDVAQISRALKHLARDLGVPVVALAQLSRAADGRTGAPLLSDLRESGAIEQDADAVLFLHRDEQAAERVTLTVAKNRNGPTGSVPLRFDAPTTRFFEEETRRPL